MKLAIFSPNRNAFSETFIQAHKKLTNNTLYYYGGLVPMCLEGYGRLYKEWYLVRYFAHIIFIIFHPHLLKYPKGFTIDQKLLGESLIKNKVTHVLAEFGPCAAETYPICKFLGIKMISHFHGYDVSQRSVINKYRTKYKDVFDYSCRVVAVSRLMEEKLVELGCQRKKIIYCPCGPSEIFLNVNPNFRANNILFVGRFVDKKAPYYLILAFNKVIKEIPDAHLTMIGDGVLHDCCLHLAICLDISNKISFEGVVNHNQIDSYYQNASVYCQPSATAESGDQEGTPVSIMEASLSGLPVVSSRHAGIPDVVLDGETGLLVNEHDIDGLANSIIKILSDKQLAKEMGQKGRKYIKENYILTKSLDTLRNMLIFT